MTGKDRLIGDFFKEHRVMGKRTFYKDIARAVAGNSFDVIRPSDNVPDFSERHKERMEKLFEKKRVFAVFYIIPKRVLIAILIALTVLAVPLSVKAIREPLFRFFSQTFGGERTELFASEEARQRALNKKIEEYFGVYYIPDGFELVSEKKTETQYLLEYSNGKETFTMEQKRISVEKPYIPDGAENIDFEYADTPWEITYYRYGGKNVFVWIYGYNEFRLTADEAISLDTLKKIADNVLDERGYEEKKIVEEGLTGELDETERPTDIWDVELSPETLPEEFGFKLPDGIRVSGWYNLTLFWEEYFDIDVRCESENKEIAIDIDICDLELHGNPVFSDIEEKVKINDEITVSYFKNISCWHWVDDKYVYDIFLWDKSITHEEIFKMIREYYGIK